MLRTSNRCDRELDAISTCEKHEREAAPVQLLITALVAQLHFGIKPNSILAKIVWSKRWSWRLRRWFWHRRWRWRRRGGRRRGWRGHSLTSSRGRRVDRLMRQRNRKAGAAGRGQAGASLETLDDRDGAHTDAARCYRAHLMPKCAQLCRCYPTSPEQWGRMLSQQQTVFVLLCSSMNTMTRPDSNRIATPRSAAAAVLWS